MAEYRRELTRNTLIWKDTCDCDRNGYQVRMITRVRIPGLLSCRCQMIDGETYFYYDATDYQQLSAIYAGRSIKRSDMAELLYAIQAVLNGIREYLLEPSAIILSPEYIFVSSDKKTYGFCYVPGRTMSFEEAFRELSEYFLEKLDHNEKEAVILGYGIYRKVREGQACLEQIMSLLEERQDLEEIKIPYTEQKKEEEKRILEPQKAGKQKKKFLWRRLLFVVIGAFAGIFACIRKGLFPGLMLPEGASGNIRIETGTKMPGMFAEAKLGWLLAVLIAAALLLAGIVLYVSKCTKKKEQLEKDISCTTMHWEDFEVVDPTVFLPSLQAGKGRKLISMDTQEETFLTGEQFIVGKRTGMGGLVIEAATVSRKHACLSLRDGDWYVEDCGSCNGTYVNGQRLEAGDQLMLMQGDEICFADKSYLYL